MEQLGKGGLVQKFAWHTRDKDRIRLGRRRVDRIDKMTLASSHKIAHLAFNVVQDPERQEPGEDEVGDVAELVAATNISERELVEARLVVHAYRVDREEDGPGDEPVRC